VAATAAGGIPEAIGMAGLTVAVDDHRALGAAQVELAEDSALRAELADVATAEAERFSVTRATATLEQIYRTASARAREA
jgi:glycosyltransferase involved in cell wall biosynthesis